MARIAWFLSACLSLIFGISTAPADFADRLTLDWPDFHPSPNESIALDQVARVSVDHRQPGIAARFADFIRRAMSHDDFVAGHFDPGRMPA